MTLQEIYETCQYQGCQCKTCGHDQGGKCRADTGDWLGPGSRGVPTRICPMCKPK